MRFDEIIHLAGLGCDACPSGLAVISTFCSVPQSLDLRSHLMHNLIRTISVHDVINFDSIIYSIVTTGNIQKWWLNAIEAGPLLKLRTTLFSWGPHTGQAGLHCSLARVT